MANDWGVKQNDNSPGVSATLKDADGAAINLSGCTVVFNMRLKKTGAIKVDEGTVTIVSATDGTVRYDWQTGDTATAGEYYIEWQITDGSGNVQTVPTNGFDELEVYEEIS